MKLIVVLKLLLALACLFPWTVQATKTVSEVDRIRRNLNEIHLAALTFQNDQKEKSAALTLQQLEPYLRTKTIIPRSGEQYIFTPEQVPRAVLTREVEGYPAGTIIRVARFESDGLGSIILPPGQTRGKWPTRKMLLMRWIEPVMIGALLIGMGVFLWKEFARLRKLER